MQGSCFCKGHFTLWRQVGSQKSESATCLAALVRMEEEILIEYVYLFLCGEDISCNLMSSFALVDDGNCGASHLLQVLLFSVFIPIKAKFETHGLQRLEL